MGVVSVSGGWVTVGEWGHLHTGGVLSRYTGVLSWVSVRVGLSN